MKVAVLESYSVSALGRLKAAGFAVGDIALSEADVALVRSRTRVNNAFFDEAPNLKLVVSATSGFDHLDWKAAEKRGVAVAHTPEANAASTAELTLGLILTFERELNQAIPLVKSGQWREDLRRPQGLDGQTLAVIGLGRVGSRVARLGAALGMRVVASDPYVGEDQFQALNADRLGFTEALRAADYLSLHVPLTSETKHLMTTSTFNEMNEHAVLINTCRGQVVSENDLLLALDERAIRGAAMDVIEREPPPKNHRLFTYPNFLLTPHIGAYTESAWERSGHAAVDRVLDFQAGRPVADRLPLKTAWFEKSLPVSD